jgi:UDP-N-acetylglucosamine 2-epimerase (non-hydrolysing)
MSCLRPLLVIGTRPEAIKMAPVIWECRRRGAEIEPIVCLTGQHQELVSELTDDLDLAPDTVLDAMCHGQSLAALAARCLEHLDRTITLFSPDCIAAVGDTTTVMSAAIAAFLREIPFVHIEAGLRTGNLSAPWPEEFNRRIGTLAAALHCAPTIGAEQNLLSEGISPDLIHVTGNTVIDALRHTVARQRLRASYWRSKFPWLSAQRLVLVTAHRRENIGPGLNNLAAALRILAERFPDAQFVMPIHPNPRVQRSFAGLGSQHPNLRMIEPISYPGFVWLLDRATLVLTDSGGLQEEAPALRKPVLVLRDVTERPEAVDSGAAEIIGTSIDSIVDSVSLLLTDSDEYARRQIDHSPYGDGHAAERIVQLMLDRAWQPGTRSPSPELVFA